LTITIFVSTACLLGHQRLTERLNLYQRNGFNDIELGARVSVERDIISNLKTWDGNFLIHNYFPPPKTSFVLNLASVNEEIRRRSVGLVCTALALSSCLGAPFYSVHAGFVTDPTAFGGKSFVFPTPSSTAERDRALGRFAETVRECMETAEMLGVDLLIENNLCAHEHKKILLLQTPDEFEEFYDICTDGKPGILLDTGHLNVSAHTLEFDRMDFVERLVPHIRALHLHDNDGNEDSHQPALGGSWVIELLKESQIQKLPWIVEAQFSSIDQLCSHVDWLRNEIRKG
jgi:sugar phosphate isomerase/epimerase